MKEDPLYPFGFGLSYTNFSYSDLRIDDDYKVRVSVTNTGDTDAEEVAQIYISSPFAGAKDPQFDLKAFQRTFIKSKETKELTFELSKESFSQYDANGESTIRAGAYTVFAGGNLPTERSEQLGGTSSLSVKTTLK